MSADDRPPRGSVSTLRRVIVGVIVASFSLAALGGIVVLLGGDLGDPAWRVLSTTAVVGGFSVAVLCCVALVGRRLQVFGLVGAAVSVVAAGLVIWMIWYRGSYGDGWETLMRVTWTFVAASAAFALASLLLLLADRRQRAVRIGLWITMILFAIVLGMTIYAIWWSDTIEGDTFGRTLGIFAILAALGAVVVPVISLILRGRSAAAGLSESARSRLEAEAARRGITPDELVAVLLDRADAPSTPAPAVGAESGAPVVGGSSEP